MKVFFYSLITFLACFGRSIPGNNFSTGQANTFTPVFYQTSSSYCTEEINYLQSDLHSADPDQILPGIHHFARDYGKNSIANLTN